MCEDDDGEKGQENNDGVQEQVNDKRQTESRLPEVDQDTKPGEQREDRPSSPDPKES